MSEKKKGVVPRLRFPEFRDAGPWEFHSISDFLTESRIEGSSGDTARKLTVKLWGKGVVRKEEYLPGSENTKYYKRRAGQFIYSKLDFLNSAFGIVPPELDGYESTTDLPAFEISPDLVASFFLEYVKRPNFFRKFGEQADGSRKAKRIQTNYFLALPVVVPAKKEQQKIADCLSSLDELIELEGKKLEALKQHKKGLMQQLFPREGETTPRLRFPEFRDAGPWEVKRLGEVFRERYERDGVGLELLSVTISDGVVRASDLERRNTASADLSTYKKVYPGDIVYNTMRMWQGASGVSHFHGIVSPAYTVVTPEDNHNSVFWAYHFKLWHSIDKFARFSQGLTSDTWNLKFPAFSAIKMAFPRDPEEQQKIADCLSSLDELIELEGKKLEALKAHKKGLMQQLFPQEVE
ncbi:MULTISPECIES: restriction endonuclease subunit S [unclassified Meiothermus]|uniref:restriction endonuclease subunit S n=1 Tax=unclassified Meiothermus TaxID=370471 RepID=UPI00131477C6|nr:MULTISPECIES: restriction endonuclease subunit S [unclassified Meiothermus]